MTLVSASPRLLDTALPLDRPLPLHALTEIAARAARRVSRSRSEPTAIPGGRWHVRLRVTPHYDVWLIGWGVGSQVDDHDHGGSAGAISVVRGRLVEREPGPLGYTERDARAPATRVAFAPERVHSVRNDTSRVALSVHTYSPALSSMTFFDDEPQPASDRSGRSARTRGGLLMSSIDGLLHVTRGRLRRLEPRGRRRGDRRRRAARGHAARGAP